MGEHDVEFGLFKDLEPSSTFACYGCDTIDPNKPMDELDITLNDPSNIDCTLFEGLGLYDVKVDSFPPNIVEIEPYDVCLLYTSPSPRD